MTGHGTLTTEQARDALVALAKSVGVLVGGPAIQVLDDYVAQTVEQAQTIRDQADENLRLQGHLERVLELVEDAKGERMIGSLEVTIADIGREVLLAFSNGKGDHAEP